MDLMAYWKWPNYLKDTKDRLSYTFNSSQEQLHGVDWDGSVWLVSMRPEGDGGGTVLLGRLVIDAKCQNEPNHPYGKYSVRGNAERSQYFDPMGPDATQVLYRLTFKSEKRLSPGTPIGQSLQTLRPLLLDDTRLLAEWSSRLALHPRLK